MCALSIGHADLFIDVAKTDPTKLAEAVHREIADGRIIFPFIFGRDLYDQYAEIFDDEKDSLTNEETLNLLESLPRGATSMQVVHSVQEGWRGSKRVRMPLRSRGTWCTNVTSSSWPLGPNCPQS
ncbi:hypothetical protein ASD16_19435 [Cellulomonas sp. Root485]|nr:hypothetical protein ASD16_19435 [Cellulomonas sp. Root485]